MDQEELLRHIMRNIREIGDPNLVTTLEAQIETLVKQLEEKSKTDELTQLPNYKGLIEILEKEFANSVRYKQPLTLAFFDINRLKYYNDTYGHLQANHAIKKVAEKIKAGIRKGDTLARYGGDEFCLVLPKVDSENSKIVISRIIESLDLLSIDGIVDGLVDEGYKKMTVSIGCTTLRMGELYTSALDRANQAMKAKKAESGITNQVKYV